MKEKITRSISKEVFVRRIYLLRKVHSVSQGELADLLGISRRTYQRMEYGESEINVQLLLKIAETFNVDINYFFFDPQEFLDKKDSEEYSPSFPVKSLNEGNLDSYYQANKREILDNLKLSVLSLKKGETSHLKFFYVSTLSGGQYSSDFKEIGFKKSEYKWSELFFKQEEIANNFDLLLKLSRNSKFFIIHNQLQVPGFGIFNNLATVMVESARLDNPRLLGQLFRLPNDIYPNTETVRRIALDLEQELGLAINYLPSVVA